MLEAEEVTLRRGGALLLDRVTLRLRRGAVTGIIGPNGAGKSTLLRVLAGLEPATAGRVALDGRPLAAIPLAERARRLAYLPQAGRIAWAIDVERLVALGRLPHRGADPAADRAAVARALEATGLEGLARRAATSLSGGERARALFARALAVESQILLADEPTEALDPRHQLLVMAELRRLAERGTTVALVLHDLTLAARFCDELAVIAAGRLAATGAPATVLTADLLEAVYATRMLSGEHQGERWIIPWRA